MRVALLLLMLAAHACALKLLWAETLPSSTSPPANSGGGAALFGTSAADPEAFYAVTTADGHLMLVNTSTGGVLWSVKPWDCSTMAVCWGRQIQGDDSGVAVVQGSTVYILRLADGSTVATFSVAANFQSAPSLYLSRRWGGVLVLCDGSTIIANSRLSNSLLWSYTGLDVSFATSIRFDPSDSGNTAFAQTCANNEGAMCVTAVSDTTGDQLVSVTTPSLELTVAVDGATVSYIRGGSVCRSTFIGAAEYCYAPSSAIYGYGLASAAGGPTGLTRLYLNLRDKVLAVNFTTGVLVGTSPTRDPNLHPHLVGMSQYALICLQKTGSSAEFVGYSFGAMMGLRFNFSVTSGSPLNVYDVSGNWDNEVLIPTNGGFYFLFGGGPQPAMNSDYATFLTATNGTVQPNTWVTRNRIFITSGQLVMAFGF